MAELFVTTASGPLVPQNVTFQDVKVNGTFTAPSFSTAPVVLNVPSGMASGPFTAPQPCPYTVTYVGTPGVTPCLVTISVAAVVSDWDDPTFATLSPTLPLNLVPPGDPIFACPTVDNYILTEGMGQCTIGSGDGTIYVETPGGGTFSAGTVGWGSFYFSYSLPPP